MHFSILIGLARQAIAFDCPDGRVIDMNLHFTHVQDFSASFKTYQNQMALALSAVSRELDSVFNVSLDGSYDGDRVTFSMVRAIDKDINNQCPTSCECNDEQFTEVKFADLQCGPSNATSCMQWLTVFSNNSYPGNNARPDVFDGAITKSQSYFNVPEKNGEKYDIRIISVGTDQCPRVSGRTTDDPAYRAKLWSRMPTASKEQWLVSSGYERDGSIYEADCNIRDYPTAAELLKNIKASSSRLISLYMNASSTCQDTNDRSVRWFYEDYLAAGCKGLDIPYVANEASFNDASGLANTIIDGIVDVACQTTTSTTTKAIIAETTPEGGEDSNVGAIVGGVLGASTVVAIAVVGALYATGVIFSPGPAPAPEEVLPTTEVEGREFEQKVEINDDQYV